MLEIYEFGQHGRELYALGERHEMRTEYIELANRPLFTGGALRIARRALDDAEGDERIWSLASAHEAPRAHLKERRKLYGKIAATS